MIFPLSLFPGFMIPFIVGFIALAIFAMVYASKIEKKRTELLAAWASFHGFRFRPKSAGTDGSMDDRYPQFDCLRSGRNRYAFNIARGEKNGRRVTAFDYHYETTSTDSKGRTQTHHHHFSAVVVDSGMALKPLFIRTEGLWDKMTSAFGFDDIDFESAEFSRKFFVKAEDRKWAYDVIHTETMAFLLETPRFKLQMAGPQVMAWRGKRLKPAELNHALGHIHGVLSRIPADIQRDLALPDSSV